MEKKTIAKYLRISPKKLLFLVDDLKAKPAEEIMVITKTNFKKGSRFIYQAIKSALTLFNKEDQAKVIVKNLIVNKGPAFKRFRPGGRGVSHPYSRRTAHLEVVLELPELKK